MRKYLIELTFADPVEICADTWKVNGGCLQVVKDGRIVYFTWVDRVKSILEVE